MIALWKLVSSAAAFPPCLISKASSLRAWSSLSCGNKIWLRLLSLLLLLFERELDVPFLPEAPPL